LPTVPTRVLILSASIGEGHDRPAHWLAEQIRSERPDAVVVVEDSLRAMGGFVTLVSETAPMVVFHRFRWLWDVGFWVFTAPAPVRALVQRGLARLGAPGIVRLVEEVQPDVIVSVYPQATEVAARLRRQGRIRVPVVAGITDVAALDYWASPGADLHLVTQPEAIDEVRRIAGPEAEVHTVTGFTDPAFYVPRSRLEARLAIGVDPKATLVVVSGGGWGVGDVQGAIEEALDVPGTTVACLTGRNDELRAGLEERFRAEPRVRIEGFTEQMADWLAAADVLVHSTGGLTVLEALLRGCPVVSYGWGRGHIRKHEEAFRRFGLADVAESRSELRAAIVRAIERGRVDIAGFGNLASGASFVLAAADAR
jgi:UDP-N-acetylglucosamine:LPS N-acetylglucosamine transferase